MPSILKVNSPIVIPYQDNAVKFVGKEEVKLFWDKVSAKKLAHKQGCYVFALKVAKGYTPWYVGKATKSMKQECLHITKLQYYNQVFNRGYKGTPVLFVVALPGTKRKVPASDIRKMERYLIRAGYAKNPHIRNIQHATKLDKWGIKGVIRGGKGKPSNTACQFSSMMGL